MPDTVYSRIKESYKVQNEFELSMKGVTSLSGYVTYIIEEILRVNILMEKFQFRFKKLSVDSDKIVLLDNYLDRVIELKNIKGIWHCVFCDRDNCLHVGFCWSFYEIYG